MRVFAIAALGATLLWPQIVELDEIVDLCQARMLLPSAKRFRGLARVVEGGLLLQDGTCPAFHSGPSNLIVPLFVKVTRPQFQRSVDAKLYQRLQDSFERPMLQVVVAGKLSCKRDFRANTVDGYTVGNGYGHAGLVLCLVEKGSIEKLEWVR